MTVNKKSSAQILTQCDVTDWTGVRGCCGDTVTGESGGHDEKLRWELALAAGVKTEVWEVAQERLYKAVRGKRWGWEYSMRLLRWNFSPPQLQ